MTFETINPSKPVSQSLFNGGGLFSKHAEDVVRSIVLKDKSLVKNFNGLETIRDQIKFLEKHASNLDFTSKVSSKEAFIEKNLDKVKTKRLFLRNLISPVLFVAYRLIFTLIVVLFFRHWNTKQREMNYLRQIS